ncbi:hypothetical protein [Algibacillus agarilyticus]|uniref:hypothetical protein n=1 Tax=Algibacillus agarilyticus TaxID=2234133 RepID=UPI000DD08085|nr:hypothetical protein [Algibacillus agarilyticus]
MIVKEFIELKKKQVSFYVKEFNAKRIPYSELNLFLWDTLEEWTQVNLAQDEPYTETERVFWHLIHLLSYWSEDKLLSDQYLKDEMLLCIEYFEFEGEGYFPFECIGIRP